MDTIFLNVRTFKSSLQLSVFNLVHHVPDRFLMFLGSIKAPVNIHRSFHFSRHELAPREGFHRLWGSDKVFEDHCCPSASRIGATCGGKRVAD